MSIARLQAMVHRARQTGEYWQKVYWAIDRRIAELRAEIEPYQHEIYTLQQLRKEADTPVARLLAPLSQPKTGLEPVAVFDGDSVSLYWEDVHSDELIEFAEWPFDQEYVLASDLEKLGFRIERA